MSHDPGVEELGTEQSSPVSITTATGEKDYVELVESPKYSLLDPADLEKTDAIVPDDEAEIFLESVSYDGGGAGSFFVHNGDDVAIRETVTYAANEPKTVAYGVWMGKGNPVHLDVSPTNGTVKVWARYRVKRSISRKFAAKYEDA